MTVSPPLVNLGFFSKPIEANIAYLYLLPSGRLTFPPFDTLLYHIGIRTDCFALTCCKQHADASDSNGDRTRDLLRDRQAFSPSELPSHIKLYGFCSLDDPIQITCVRQLHHTCIVGTYRSAWFRKPPYSYVIVRLNTE